MSSVPAGAAAGDAEVTECGPWNPGVYSEPSRHLLSRCTMFRAENVFTSVERATELSGVSGLPFTDLVVYRPERLALHEVLVRVATEYEIPDPEDAPVQSLGVNFRRMTHTILARYIGPHMPELVGEYERLKAALARMIQAELSSVSSPTSSSGDRSHERLYGLRRWFRPGSEARAPSFDEYEWERDDESVAQWTAEAHSDAEGMHAAACRSLATVVPAMRSKHGRLWGDKALLGALATDLACNDYGAATIGRLVEPYIRQAAECEGYRRLPPQDRPVIMSTKGASAAGKSTMRPLQRRLVASMGKRWSDFSLISPDIFRRDLLDFDSLGSAHKYGGIFTSDELVVVDRKLDRHRARNAEQGLTPHLLIDRFRFDSFAPDSEEERRLLARLGRPELIHYLFMITPPEATVERAWRRGLEIGRYKPVNDLLAHNVEAYTGIPKFLFARALQPGRPIHYEFLDNDVPRGEVPLTVAFGWSGEMSVLDIECLLDMDRYRKINVNATKPSEVYPGRAEMAPERNLEFLTECVRRFPRVNFADRDTGHIYVRMQSGRLTWFDARFCAAAVNSPDSRAAMQALAPAALRSVPPGADSAPQYLDRDRFYTLGRWGMAVPGVTR